mmetsp:Transcript_30892/g.95582  ORF Transcript_30892/g.95582 Transcript_30892/m.95582 type:complete len:88 (+) Transcript_30892:2506-2769(+)
MVSGVRLSLIHVICTGSAALSPSRTHSNDSGHFAKHYKPKFKKTSEAMEETSGAQVSFQEEAYVRHHISALFPKTASVLSSVHDDLC